MADNVVPLWHAWGRGRPERTANTSMTANPCPPWSDLFAHDDATGETVTLDMQMLRRDGEPMLLTPTRPRFAAVALSMYPAQRAKARLFRNALRVIWSLGIPVPFEKLSVSIDPQAAFPKFVAQWAPTRSDIFPPFAILCGIPGRWRRFIILVFAPDGKPASVVKAGMSAVPMRLIDQEVVFLKSVPPSTPSIPELRDSFEGEHVHALALNFVHGSSPSAEDHNGVERLLTSWLHKGEPQRLSEMPAWQAVESACRSHPRWESVAAVLRNRSVRPTVFHGDFAPWNIRASARDGSWTVLDWERGELTGIPGWDWFHYVFRSNILTEGMSLSEAGKQIHKLTSHPSFIHYSAIASIDGFHRELFAAYLICYNVRYGLPENGPELDELLLQLAVSWPTN